MRGDVTTGTIVDGRYEVKERLGSGGMAAVYRAQDLQLGREVALKLLYPRFAEDESFVERFRREASAAAGLQHPNVVSVYDRGEWDGTSYIAMELVTGRTLRELVQETGPMDPVRAIDCTIGVLRAARFAHRRGIVHRDLKPHNVLVDGEGRAKVTDFGIAKAGASDMTETGSIMGTAQYMSPEQAQGLATSPRSDLYADRRPALRAARRTPAVRRRDGGEHRAQAGLRAAGPAGTRRRRRPARARRRRAPRAREGPRAALRRRRRVHRRAGGRAVRRDRRRAGLPQRDRRDPRPTRRGAAEAPAALAPRGAARARRRCRRRHRRDAAARRRGAARRARRRRARGDRRHAAAARGGLRGPRRPPPIVAPAARPRRLPAAGGGQQRRDRVHRSRSPCPTGRASTRCPRSRGCAAPRRASD